MEKIPTTVLLLKDVNRNLESVDVEKDMVSVQKGYAVVRKVGVALEYPSVLLIMDVNQNLANVIIKRMKNIIKIFF